MTPIDPAHPRHPVVAAIERWRGIAERYGLDSAASAVGALLLSTELDERAHEQLVGAPDAHLPPTRSHVLHALAGSVQPAALLDALAALEELGLTRASRHEGVWLAQPIALADAVRLRCLREPRLGGGPVEPAPILPRVRARLDWLAPRLRDDRGAWSVVVRGDEGTGRDTVVAELLAASSRAALVRRTVELRHETRLEPRLSGSVAVWDARGRDASPEERERASSFLSDCRTFVVTILDPDQDAPSIGRTIEIVDTNPVDHDERVRVWTMALARAGRDGPRAEALARRLAARFGAGTSLACRALRDVSDADLEPPFALVAERLEAIVGPSRLRGVAVERDRARLDDVIVTPDVRSRLELFLALAGEVRDGTRRRGAKALLSGPPGTGKTLAARALATELGRPLLRVDTASVVSKWVGETEKNLRGVFAAARAIGGVLLFDDGESLIGKRLDAERASDRYANLEVGYLLQEIERHDAPLLVTTNLAHEIDRAFSRRFDLVVSIGPPGPEERRRLWAIELGRAATQLDRATLDALATRVELTGGHIAAASRIALALAAQAGRAAPSEADLVDAICEELVKKGNQVAAARLRERSLSGAA